MKNYENNYIHNTDHRISEGIWNQIRNTTLQSKVDLNTELQRIAIKTTLHKTIKICLLYIPPHDPINENELNNILHPIFYKVILTATIPNGGCKTTN